MKEYFSGRILVVGPNAGRYADRISLEVRAHDLSLRVEHMSTVGEAVRELLADASVRHVMIDLGGLGLGMPAKRIVEVMGTLNPPPHFWLVATAYTRQEIDVLVRKYGWNLPAMPKPNTLQEWMEGPEWFVPRLRELGGQTDSAPDTVSPSS